MGAFPDCLTSTYPTNRHDGESLLEENTNFSQTQIPLGFKKWFLWNGSSYLPAKGKRKITDIERLNSPGSLQQKTKQNKKKKSSVVATKNYTAQLFLLNITNLFFFCIKPINPTINHEARLSLTKPSCQNQKLWTCLCKHFSLVEQRSSAEQTDESSFLIFFFISLFFGVNEKKQ